MQWIQYLPLTVTPLRISVPARALIPRLHNHIILLSTIIHTVVALGIAPTGRALPAGLRQHLLGFIAGRSAVGTRGVRVSGWALVAGLLYVGVGDCGGGE